MQLILFDVDGTLVDSQDLIVRAQAEAFASQGLPAPSRQRALSVVGLSLAEAFMVLTEGTGPVAALAEAYKLAFQRLRADPAHHEPLFPAADATLRSFAARPATLVGVATGKSRRGVDYLVDRFGWEGLFATVQTADDAPSKPHPAMILQALAETGADPAEAVMVGDSTFDMAMARAAGIRAVGVSWGYHRPQALVEAGAETILDRFEELAPLLDGTRRD